MTDKETPKASVKAEPVTVNIVQPDKAAEGAANMVKAQEILAKAEADYAKYDVGGRKLTAAEYDAEAAKAAGQ